MDRRIVLLIRVTEIRVSRIENPRMIREICLKDYDLLAILALGVIGIGMLINWISTFFAVNKYLNIKTDKLY